MGLCEWVVARIFMSLVVGFVDDFLGFLRDVNGGG